jgi:hypothetical protein
MNAPTYGQPPPDPYAAMYGGMGAQMPFDPYQQQFGVFGAMGGAMGGMGADGFMGGFNPYMSQYGMGGLPGMGGMGLPPMLPHSMPSRAPPTSQGASAKPRGLSQRGANQSDLCFRVLCPSKSSGSVIGQGGSVISSIRQETGAHVLIGGDTPGCTDRLVTIFSQYTPPRSQAQEALQRVARCICDRGTPAEPQPATAECSIYMVLTKQQGAVLNSLLTQLGNESGCDVRLQPPSFVPSFLSADQDELVELKGMIGNILVAFDKISAYIVPTIQLNHLLQKTGVLPGAGSSHIGPMPPPGL